MIEKVKNFDYLNASDAQVEELLNEMVELPKDELKEVVNNIVDTIDYKFTSDDTEEKLPNSYEVIFNNPIIKDILEELLKDYEQTVD
jgi:predicted hydrolase (HD superfamily)